MENKDKDSSTNNQTRLQSLRLPRDLTLAVSRPNRRQFTPNLNVTRQSKTPAVQVPTSEDKEKQPQGRKDRPNRNNRKPNFIQTEGIFSQGGASSFQSNIHKRPSSSSSRTSSSNTTRRIKNSDISKIKVEDEDESSSDSNEENFVLAPLYAPAPTMVNSVSTNNPSLESCDVDEENEGKVPRPFCNSHSSENPALCLVSIPPVFRGTEYEHSKDGDQIGKLQILKSGRMRAQIGDQWYDFDETDYYTAKQDAVLIKNEDSRPEAEPNYSMVELGSLINNFTISVNYEDLLLNP